MRAGRRTGNAREGEDQRATPLHGVRAGVASESDGGRGTNRDGAGADMG